MPIEVVPPLRQSFWRQKKAYASIALIAFSVLAIPRMLITRFKLYASTCRLISVRTLANLRVKKWAQPQNDPSATFAC